VEHHENTSQQSMKWWLGLWYEYKTLTNGDLDDPASSYNATNDLGFVNEELNNIWKTARTGTPTEGVVWSVMVILEWVL